MPYARNAITIIRPFANIFSELVEGDMFRYKDESSDVYMKTSVGAINLALGTQHSPAQTTSIKPVFEVTIKRLP